MAEKGRVGNGCVGSFLRDPALDKLWELTNEGEERKLKEFSEQARNQMGLEKPALFSGPVATKDDSK